MAYLHLPIKCMAMIGIVAYNLTGIGPNRVVPISGGVVTPSSTGTKFSEKTTTKKHFITMTFTSFSFIETES